MPIVFADSIAASSTMRVNSSASSNSICWLRPLRGAIVSTSVLGTENPPQELFKNADCRREQTCKTKLAIITSGNRGANTKVTKGNIQAHKACLRDLRIFLRDRSLP